MEASYLGRVPAPAIHSRSCWPWHLSGGGTPSLNGSGGHRVLRLYSACAALVRRQGSPSLAHAPNPRLPHPMPTPRRKPAPRCTPSSCDRNFGSAAPHIAPPPRAVAANRRFGCHRTNPPQPHRIQTSGKRTTGDEKRCHAGDDKWHKKPAPLIPKEMTTEESPISVKSCNR